MACRYLSFGFVGVYFVIFILPAISSCNFDSECDNQLHCCGGICVDTPCWNTNYCFQNTDCQGSRICCFDSGDCRFDYSDCPMAAGAIAGIVCGVLIFLGIVIGTIVSCCVCISCPLHPARRRQPAGRIVASAPPNYQTITSTTDGFHQGTYPQPGQYPSQQHYHGGRPYQPQQFGNPPQYQ